MYRVLLSKTAEKDLNKISEKQKPHIFAAIFDLKKDPYVGKKLKGKFKDCFSLRVGDYRIIYKVYKKELNILIIGIGNRQGIYN